MVERRTANDAKEKATEMRTRAQVHPAIKVDLESDKTLYVIDQALEDLQEGKLSDSQSNSQKEYLIKIYNTAATIGADDKNKTDKHLTRLKRFNGNSLIDDVTKNKALDGALSMPVRNLKMITEVVTQLPMTTALVKKLETNELLSVLKPKLESNETLLKYALESEAKDIKFLIDHELISKKQVVMAYIQSSGGSRDKLRPVAHKILSTYTSGALEALINPIKGERLEALITDKIQQTVPKIEKIFQERFVTAAKEANLQEIEPLMLLWPNQGAWTPEQSSEKLYRQALEALFSGNPSMKQLECIKTIAQNNPANTHAYFADKINKFPLTNDITNLYRYIHTNEAAEVALKKIATEGTPEQFETLYKYLMSNKNLEETCTNFCTMPLADAAQSYPALVAMKLNEYTAQDAIDRALDSTISFDLTQKPIPEDIINRKIKILQTLLDADIPPSQKAIATMLTKLYDYKTNQGLNDAKIPVESFATALAKASNITDEKLMAILTNAHQQPQENHDAFVARTRKTLFDRFTDPSLSQRQNSPLKALCTPDNQHKLATEIISDAMNSVLQSNKPSWKDKFLSSKEEKTKLLTDIKNEFDKIKNNPDHPNRLEWLAKLANTFSETAHIQRGLLNLSGGKKSDARSGILFDQQVGNALRHITVHANGSKNFKAEVKNLEKREVDGRSPSTPRPK